MTRGRDNQAARLSDILELIQARQQSGLLSVERFADGRFDEGDIYFKDGLPIYVHAGNLVGEDALAWLASWRQVYFSFVKGVSPPVVPPIQPQPKVLLKEGDPVYGLASSRPGLPPTGIDALIPQKLLGDQGVLSLPLTRPQRSIYLLVDGRRSIADLARCTRKNTQDVRQILNELREHGLISLERS